MPAKIRIGYDASVTLAPNGGGIARYTLELLRALVDLNAPDLEFIVLLNSFRHRPGPAHDFLRRADNVKAITRRRPGPLIVNGWKNRRRPTWEKLTGTACDLVYAPASYFPPTNAPLVATVHDLAFLRDEKRNDLAGSYFAEEFPRRLPECAAIITPSQHVASDIANTYRIDMDKIHPIHSGINGKVFNQQGPKNDAVDIFAVTDERIERKRADWIPKVLAALKKEPNPSAAVLGMDPTNHLSIRILNRMNDEQLATMYRGSILSLMTTREEGFGFPLLESLACGTPVVCGRHSSLAEIGGEFAHFAKEDTVESFAERINEVLDDPPDNDWKRAASDYARSFTWEKTARAVTDLFRRVV